MRTFIVINKTLLWSAISIALVSALTWFVYRPWALTWGATGEEISRPMPGDQIMNDPTFNATRAVTVRAAPEDIWPWLVQMGYKRAGFYSYDWLDNDAVPSAEKILPEYQDLEVGDLIPMNEHSSIAVEVLESASSLLLVYGEGSWTWAWGLYREDSQSTRLVTRLRTRPTGIVSRVLMDLFEIVMMRKCLLGIKRRAEASMD